VIFWPLGDELWHGNGHPATIFNAGSGENHTLVVIMGYENVAFWQ